MDTSAVTNTFDGAPAGVLPILREQWPELPWQSLREAHGAFHHVLLLPPVAAVRIRTGAEHELATRREHETAAALAAAGLPVPRPLRDPVHAEQWSAAVVTFTGGAVREPGSWAVDRAGILPLLEAWAEAGAGHPELSARLPAARSWCGGPEWPALVARMTESDPEVLAAARTRLDGVLECEASAELSAVHGDFGLHNLLWTPAGEACLIDTDHASWADPAIDVAPLLAVYPTEELAVDLGSALLERAAAYRRTLSLQVAAAAQLRGDVQLRDHALANFRRRLRSGDPRW